MIINADNHDSMKQYLMTVDVDVGLMLLDGDDDDDDDVASHLMMLIFLGLLAIIGLCGHCSVLALRYVTLY